MRSLFSWMAAAVFSSIVNPETGEVIVEKDTNITPEVAKEIQDSGINIVYLKVNDKKVKVIGNGTVDIKSYVDPKIAEELEIKVDVNYEVLKNILETTAEEDLRKVIEERYDELVPKHVVTEDILASINYLLNLLYLLFDIYLLHK